MVPMRKLHWALALMRKGSKNRAISLYDWFTFECGRNSILPKAASCVTLEVGCRGSVLRIQIAAHTMRTVKACTGRTRKKMILSAIFIANLDVGFEERVDG